jgi:hypothetical protein
MEIDADPGQVRELYRGQKLDLELELANQAVTSNDTCLIRMLPRNESPVFFKAQRPNIVTILKWNSPW